MIELEFIQGSFTVLLFFICTCTHKCIHMCMLLSLVITQVTTVDRYQGQQNDYIILSLVRTKHVGHLRDARRLVVAMSRARLGLYVLARVGLFQSCTELQPAFTLVGTYLMCCHVFLLTIRIVHCTCSCSLVHTNLYAHVSFSLSFSSKVIHVYTCMYVL